MRSTSENSNVFITWDENYFGIYWRRVNFLFYFIVNTPMHTSDLMTNVIWQNMTIMGLCSVFKLWSAGETNGKSKSCYQNVPYILTKKMHINTWQFCSETEKLEDLKKKNWSGISIWGKQSNLKQGVKITWSCSFSQVKIAYPFTGWKCHFY